MDTCRRHILKTLELRMGSCDPVPAAGARLGRVALSGPPRPGAQQGSSGFSSPALRFSPRLRKWLFWMISDFKPGFSIASGRNGILLSFL